jgi:hypothetical protein
MRLVAWCVVAMVSVLALGGWGFVSLRGDRPEKVAPWKKAIEEGTVILLESRSTEKVATGILPVATVVEEGEYRIPAPPANLPPLPPPSVDIESTRR